MTPLICTDCSFGWRRLNERVTSQRASNTTTPFRLWSATAFEPSSSSVSSWAGRHRRWLTHHSLAVDLTVPAGTSSLPLNPQHEHAVMVIDGTVEVAGERLTPGPLLYLGTNRDAITVTSTKGLTSSCSAVNRSMKS